MDDFIEEDINAVGMMSDKEMSDDEFDTYMEQIRPLIGSVVVSFNDLDDSVNYYIREMVSDSFYRDEVPWIFISEMPFTAKIRVIEKLYNFNLRWSDKNYSDPLSILVKRLYECAKKRNMYVHANWKQVNSEKYVSIRTRVRHEGARHVYKVMDTESMQKDIDFIDSVNDELQEFNHEYIEG